MDLWLRPWAFYAPLQRKEKVTGTVALSGVDASITLVRFRGAEPPTLGRPTDNAEPYVSVRTQGGEAIELAMLPFPLLPSRGLLVRDRTDVVNLVWPDAPDRPRERGAGIASEPGVPLMQRARAVWDRTQDVEEALADPATLWQQLHDRWTGTDAGQPQMHVIVRHARELTRIIDLLERRPRRVLRRVQKTMPVGRVQEIDRRAMLWLARQPGEKLAEKAGDRQRIQGVAREENFDTLENRVLRAYVELAARTARDYLMRNQTKRATRRAKDVERFMRRCQLVARNLSQRSVRLAEPGVTPNFVLQQNPQYRAIWVAWQELREQDRIEDDLWRWQCQSWAEYCSLALMVALIGVPDAQVVATAPIWFRDEQRRGSWIEADSPLGVVYLPNQDLIVEVANTRNGAAMARLGARLVLRLRRVGDADGYAAEVPVWPLWAVQGGVTPGDLLELKDAFGHLRGAGLLRGALVMRPAADADSPVFERDGISAALALGTEGAALSQTLRSLTEYLHGILQVEKT